MSRQIIAETYVASLEDRIEYGFVFKLEGCADSLFDVVLGETAWESQDVINADWAKYQWVADAIVKGQP